MIIGLTVENWKSFKNSTAISLVARDINVHEERIQSLDHFGIKTLPVVAIYGGNASGKTNFIDALKFAQSMVVEGTKNEGTISVIPFLLSDEDNNKPTKFVFELVIDEVYYEYGFIVSNTRVLEEVLKKILPNNNEVLLFHRNKQNFRFGAEISRYTEVAMKKGIRSNELALSKSNSINLIEFLPIYNWFKESLLILSAGTKLFGLTELIEENGTLLEALNEALYFFDTGMSGVEIVKLNPDVVKALFPDGNIPINLVENPLTGNSGLQDSSFSISIKAGEPVVYRLMSNHNVSKEKVVRFGLHLESEGSRRLLDLLPSFLKLTSDSSLDVLVIDEIDRSMHPDLTLILIKKFLETNNESTRKQLVFTTHDYSLIESSVLRRDEICVTERDIEGISRLHSFGDFKDIGENENIFELYKSGVLGGKPHILYKHSISNPFIDPDNKDDI